MLCQKCGIRNAQIHIKESVNGVETEQSLCHICAQAADHTIFGKSKVNPFIDLNEVMQLELNSLKNGTLVTFSPKFSNKSCPLCGSAFAHLVESGKVGCAKCYEIFSTELEKTITAIHGNVHHTGKINESHMQDLEKQRKISELTNQLQLAVEEQRFEDAAKIRDEIKFFDDALSTKTKEKND